MKSSLLWALVIACGCGDPDASLTRDAGSDIRRTARPGAGDIGRLIDQDAAKDKHSDEDASSEESRDVDEDGGMERSEPDAATTQTDAGVDAGFDAGFDAGAPPLGLCDDCNETEECPDGWICHETPGSEETHCLGPPTVFSGNGFQRCVLYDMGTLTVQLITLDGTNYCFPAGRTCEKWREL